MTSPESLPGPANPLPRRASGGLLTWAITLAIAIYTLVLGLLIAGLELVGERWWPFAVLLYLPQRVFWLPLIILVPAALLVEVPAGVWALVAATVIIFFWHVPYYMGISRSPGPIPMKVLSNNYAQNHNLSINPFIRARDPDFVALVDSSGLGPVFQRNFPDRIVRAEGQFVFMSKTPVLSAGYLDWPRWRGSPVAAVFVAPWQGRDVAFYTVHLPSPRPDFAKLAGLGLARELLGRNQQRSGEMSFSDAMTARAELARELAQVFAQEKRPFVAMGDFNMPENGYVHRVITGPVTDSFAKAGWGFGLTFPCDRHNPITLGQPWLRLDYILAGPGWRVDNCIVEPGRRSKHRAVSATLDWQ